MDRLVLSHLNREIFALYRAHKSIQRTKIAILDTGYYDDSQFFSKRKSRLSSGHWKDFVGDSPAPVDDDGHGTHVLSIAMKIAPSADLCVARVTKNSKDFVGSHQRIAEVSTMHFQDIQKCAGSWYRRL